jgi:hypothetical protein
VTVWRTYFADNRPAPAAVSRHVESLHTAKQHQEVIALLQAALINGQSQPWMYEVLALSMTIEGRPEAEIERVVLSLADFGTTDYGSLTFSAAYLSRLGRESAALKLYHEAVRMAPEQPEAYVLSLRLARRLKDAEAMGWAAEGILRFGWTRDWKTLHREAENAAAEAAQLFSKAGQTDAAAELESRIAEARRRDLALKLAWTGEGDLDLIVEEPSGSVCAFDNPSTVGGGMLLHDGYGPEVANCYEEYVCPLALKGDYRVRVRHAWGDVVGRRARLTIIRGQGTAAETVETQTVVIGSEEPVIRVALAEGRREQLRLGGVPDIGRRLAGLGLDETRGKPGQGVQRAAAEFVESRSEAERLQIRQVGAVGFQPVIQIVPDGATFAARVAVSPDRRYVRIGVSPTFTNITDVFTFTFFGGAPQPGTPPGN